MKESKMSWEQGLFDEQIHAVSHKTGHACVLAGPGTGKTRTLIHRVGYLLEVQQIQPSEILVLTFTRAAAQELKERLVKQLGVPEEQIPWAGTLHAFALGVLLNYRSQSGFSDEQRIADDFEENNVIFPEIGWILKKKKKQVEKAMRAYSAKWDTLNSNHPEWQEIEFQRDFENTLKSLGNIYKFKLRSELIYELWNFLLSNPLIGEQLGIKHVLVDEYQDLNECDQSVIRQIEGFGAVSFVVGDENQSIYSFRHAEANGIINISKGRSTYSLTLCTRCPSNVIVLAKRLIALRRELKAHPPNKEGEIAALQFIDHDEEAKSIAAICSAYIRTERLKPNDISILLVKKRLKKHILAALVAEGLPVTDLVPTWPLGDSEDDEQSEGRQIYCKLRLLNNRCDALALRTWLQLQSGVAEASINAAREYCISNQLALWEGLVKISQDYQIIPRHGRRLKAKYDALKSELDSLETLNSLDEVLDNILGEDSGDSDSVKTGVRRFIDLVRKEERADTLEKLLRALQTFDLKSESLLGNDAIKVMTMHKAKGLSSELVIIPGLEDGIMPSPERDTEESRRLLYVAMTRTSKFLILTHVRDRDYWQRSGNPQGARSIFLRQMQIESTNGNQFTSRLIDFLYSNVSDAQPSDKDVNSTNDLRDREFDVFLAHNSEDKALVNEIAVELRKRRLHPWLDKEQVAPGRWFQDVIQEAIPKVKSAAIFIGAKGFGKWQVVEIRTFISQCVERGIPVIPVLLPKTETFPPEFLFLRELNWVKFHERTDEVEALDNLEWGITGERPFRG
jgi:DNA helicase-2/ATP-dependent DNA helicase PcrA